MAFTLGAYAISANSHSAALFRLALQGMVSGGGVIPGAAALVVSQNGTPNMSVNVSAGVVYIPGTLGATSGMQPNFAAQTGYGLPSGLTSQGTYVAYNDATVNLAISAADPTNPRIDLVCASIQDAQYSGSNNQAVLQIITGTAAPSPSAPTAPASSVVVAQVAVAAGASSIVTANITDERQFFNPAGAILRTSGTSQYPSSASAAGLYVDDSSLNALMRYNGSAWIPLNYGPWTTYTPTWTGATTNPAIGNGNLAGRYLQQGKRIVAQWYIGAGSTTTFGSGVWGFGLPVASNSSQPGNAVGRVFAQNFGNYYVQGEVLLGANSTSASLWLPASTSASNLSQVSQGTPWTFKASDSFNFTLEYEAA